MNIIKPLMWLSEVTRFSNLSLKTFRIDESNRTDLNEYAQARKRVFVDKLKWNIEVIGDCEYDQFDNDQAHYSLVYHNNKLAFGARGNKVGEDLNKPKTLIEEFKRTLPEELDCVSLSSNDWDVTRLLITGSAPKSLIKKIIGFRLVFESQINFAKQNSCTRLLAITSPKIAAHFSTLGFKTHQISEPIRFNDTTGIYCVYCIYV